MLSSSPASRRQHCDPHSCQRLSHPTQLQDPRKIVDLAVLFRAGSCLRSLDLSQKCPLCAEVPSLQGTTGQVTKGTTASSGCCATTPRAGIFPGCMAGRPCWQLMQANASRCLVLHSVHAQLNQAACPCIHFLLVEGGVLCVQQQGGDVSGVHKTPVVGLDRVQNPFPWLCPFSQAQLCAFWCLCPTASVSKHGRSCPFLSQLLQVSPWQSVASSDMKHCSCKVGQYGLHRFE